MPSQDSSRLAANILRAVRKSKGFRSAKTAAEFHGWSVSKYQSHESGVRPIRRADAERYAAGYDVSSKLLTHPDPVRVASFVDRSRDAEIAARRSAASRLKCARVLAGFKSAMAAAKSWRWAEATYAKHENGENDLRNAVQMYAEAFGVSGTWLRDGVLPSGMGAEIDAIIADAVAAPERFLGMRTRLRPPDPDRLPRPAKRTGRPIAALGLKEYRWNDLAAGRGRLESVASTAVWSVPPEAIPDRSVFVVVSADSTRRMFVLPTSSPGRAGRRYLVAAGRTLHVVEGPVEPVRAWRILGLVIGTMDSTLPPPKR